MCLVDMEPGDNMRCACSLMLRLLTPFFSSRSIPCNHVFHSACLDQWLASAPAHLFFIVVTKYRLRLRDTCPQCRFPVYSDERPDCGRFKDNRERFVTRVTYRSRTVTPQPDLEAAEAATGPVHDGYNALGDSIV